MKRIRVNIYDAASPTTLLGTQAHFVEPKVQDILLIGVQYYLIQKRVLEIGDPLTVSVYVVTTVL